MYIDTSVAAKLYTPEPDSDQCEEVMMGEILVSSKLLYCELRSALFRKETLGRISPEQRKRAWQEFEQDLALKKIHLVSFNDTLLEDAAELMASLHPIVPLRTLDAIHLASCLSVDAGSLFTTDERMRQAAERLGLTLAKAG